MSKFFISSISALVLESAHSFFFKWSLCLTISSPFCISFNILNILLFPYYLHFWLYFWWVIPSCALYFHQEFFSIESFLHPNEAISHFFCCCSLGFTHSNLPFLWISWHIVPVRSGCIHLNPVLALWYKPGLQKFLSHSFSAFLHSRWQAFVWLPQVGKWCSFRPISPINQSFVTCSLCKCFTKSSWHKVAITWTPVTAWQSLKSQPPAIQSSNCSG